MSACNANGSRHEHTPLSNLYIYNIASIKAHSMQNVWQLKNVTQKGWRVLRVRSSQLRCLFIEFCCLQTSISIAFAGIKFSGQLFQIVLIYRVCNALPYPGYHLCTPFKLYHFFILRSGFTDPV